MKTITLLCSLLLFLCSNKVAYSQHFTIGVKNGINISDIHGQDFGGKWSHKPGASTGLSFGYSFNKTITIETGLGYSSVYYEYKTYTYPVYYPYFYDINPLVPSYYSIAPFYYNPQYIMNIGYVRLPILFSITIPSVVNFNIRTGIYYSFLKDNSINSSYYPYDIKPKKIDFGYLFSSGLEYQVTNNLNARIDLNYIAGRKTFLENYKLRNGYSEFLLGIDYNFTNKKTNAQGIVKDSTTSKVTVTYLAGMNISWNGFSSEGNRYYPVTGASIGFSLNFPLGRGVSLITGTTFERKGYSMRDSSSSFYRHKVSEYQMSYVKAMVQTDYAVIPLLINVPVGKSQRIFINTGPYLALRLNARNAGVAYTKTRSASDYSYQKTDINDDLSRLIKSNETGWLFSSGFTLPFPGSSELSIALKYATGFRDIFNAPSLSEQQHPQYEEHSIRNRTVSLVLGITFPPRGI